MKEFKKHIFAVFSLILALALAIPASGVVAQSADEYTGSGRALLHSSFTELSLSESQKAFSAPRLSCEQTSSGLKVTLEEVDKADIYELYMSINGALEYTLAASFTNTSDLSVTLPAELSLYRFRTRAGIITPYGIIWSVTGPITEITVDSLIPATLEEVNSFDFLTDSCTGLSTRELSTAEITKKLASYGTFTGGGMPYSEYSEAMEQEWTDCTVYGKTPSAVKVDINTAYKYSDLVNIMESLSQYEGVYLYDIGDTYEGRDMYALEVDIPSDCSKNTIVLTGSIHAREIAGSVYILKEIADLLSADTKEAKAVLEQTRFLICACCNPDGREGVAFNTSKYTYNDGQLWKAAANGTDLNRNFPGVSCGQILKGNRKSSYISSSSAKIYYPGDYLGCNPETKALMKFIYYGVAVEQASLLIDYHQQGRISYAGKPWQTTAQELRCKTLAKDVFTVINQGNKSTYTYVPEESSYGLDGVGSTLTDYACSIATGAKYSPAYGFCVYTNGSAEYPLIMLKDLDSTKINIEEVNPSFATMTFEIGSGRSYLGYSADTRKKLAEEYEKYNFDKVLYKLAELAG